MADLEWSFEVSGNAKEQLDLVDEALKGLPTDLAQVEAALAKLNRASDAQRIAKIQDPLKQNRALLELQARELRDVAKAAEQMADAEKHAGQEAKKAAKAGGAAKAGDDHELGKSMLEGAGLGDMLKLGTAAGAAGMAVEAVVGTLKKAISLASDLTVGFVTLGIEASTANKRQIGSLKGLEGEQSEQVLGRLEEMARAAGRSDEKAVDAFRSLRNAGLDTAEALDVLAASSDVKWMAGGSEEAAASYEEVFKKIQTLSKVGAKDLVKLTDAGIALPDLAEALGKRTGKTADEALKALRKGTADSMAVQNALLDVVDNAGGNKGLGSIAQTESVGDVQAQYERLGQIAGDLFENVDATPIANALARVSDLLNGEFGERLTAVINKSFSWIAEQIASVDLEKWLGRGVAAVEYLSDAWDGLSEGLEPALLQLRQLDAVMTTVNEAMGHSEDSVGGWKIVGTAIGGVVVAVVATVDAIRLLIDAAEIMYLGFMKLSTGVGELIGSGIGDLFGIGKDASKGMAEGIRAGQADVEKAASDMAKAVPETARTDLRTHSPSREMADIGWDTGEGFKLGLDDSDPANALNFAVSPPDLEGLPMGGAGGSFTMGDIIVQGASDPETTADRVEERMRALLEEMLAA